jgi:hypothetical protein
MIALITTPLFHTKGDNPPFDTFRIKELSDPAAPNGILREFLAFSDTLGASSGDQPESQSSALGDTLGASYGERPESQPPPSPSLGAGQPGEHQVTHECRGRLKRSPARTLTKVTTVLGHIIKDCSHHNSLIRHEGAHNGDGYVQHRGFE